MITEHSGVRFIYLLLDLLLLNIAVFIVFHFSPMDDYMALEERNLYILHANVAELLAYMLYVRRNYFFSNKIVDRLKIRLIRFAIYLAILYATATIILPKGYPTFMLLEYSFFFFLFKLSFFTILFKVHRYRYRKENRIQRVAILGVDESKCAIGELFDNNPKLGFKFVGCVSEQSNATNENLLGNLDNLATIALRHRLNVLFVTNPAYFSDKKTRELLTICNEAGVRMNYIMTNKYWSGMSHKNVESENFFEIYNPQFIPLDRLSNRVLKRTFDLLFSVSVILFIFSWFIPLMSLIIKLNSKGPVFFVQQRTGINNKTFNCLKFRTMKVNNEADTKQAQINDDRITSIGNFLRKSNIDEFPQFFNVLMGHMSIVGPRPHMLKHTDQYSELIRYYKVRHFVKPGITGWAQVNGFRGITDELWKMEKRVEYDMTYLNNWTLLWDMKIILYTVLRKSAFKNAT